MFDTCMYITFIGSLVIFIKKRVSRQITQRIPKSNILPQHTNNQVRPNNEISTGDLFLLHQKYLDLPFFVFKLMFLGYYLSFVVRPITWTPKRSKTTVFPHIAAATILFWILKSLKNSYSFLIKFSLMLWKLK